MELFYLSYNCTYYVFERFPGQCLTNVGIESCYYISPSESDFQAFLYTTEVGLNV